MVNLYIQPKQQKNGLSFLIGGKLQVPETFVGRLKHVFKRTKISALNKGKKLISD